MKYREIVCMAICFLFLNMEVDAKLIVRVALKDLDTKNLKEKLNVVVIDSTEKGQFYVTSGDVETIYEKVNHPQGTFYKIVNETSTTEKSPTNKLGEIMRNPIVYAEFLSQKEKNIIWIKNLQ